jgi:site-specific DNA-methyltransferase (adenine-specific)/modification methylase
VTWTIHTGDCLEFLRTLPTGSVDAVVTDPPYGIGYDPAESSQQGIQSFAMIAGDDVEFDPSPWLGFPDVILWGANNYCNRLPNRVGQWYFWDKVLKNDLGVRIAEGEFCWHKRGTKPRSFRHLWSGAYRASESGMRSEHPTQKPVALMRWCMDVAGIPVGATVFDPYCGSGSTGVACIQTGRNFIGCEIDPGYAEIARRRCADAAPLFVPQPREPEPMLLGATT